LRADYPLILPLFEPAYPCALTWSYIARPISARTLSVSLTRDNHPAPGRIDIRFHSNYCSPERAPSARESTWALTPAPASVREIQLHADKQLMPSVENQCANRRGSTEFDSREIDSFFVGQISGICRCRSHMVLRGCHMRKSTAGAHFGSVVTFQRASSGARLGQVRSIKEDHIMSQSRGAVSFEPLFTAEDIGLRKEANVEHVMKVFVILDHVRPRCRRAGNYWARCPSCADHGRDRSSDNLAISVSDSRKYKCWAGCTKEMIRAALGHPIRVRRPIEYGISAHDAQ
jgi:hypothetical protein